jgi:isochorismate synthase
VVAIYEQVYTLEHLQALAAKAYTTPTLISVTEPISPLNPFRVFRQAYGLDRAFWSNGKRRVGIGTAYTIESHGTDRFTVTAEAWSRLLANAVIHDSENIGGPILFGGFAFDPQCGTTPLWEGFPDGRMTLPTLMFTFADDSTWLTANFIVQPGQPVDLTWIQQTLERVVFAPESLGAETHITAIEEVREAEAWERDVAYVADAIQAGELEKAVLARAIRLCADRPFDEAAALERLAANFGDCMVFAVGRGDRCFLGATPERLASVHGDRFATMVLAGSARRGATPQEDDQVGRDLLNSAKDRHEHAVVLQTILESISGAVDAPQYHASPELLKLGNVQHLCTPIVGKLAEGVSLMGLVQRLHPTPAVGGRPLDTALALIREREGLDRGWYAAPIGWIDARGEGEFAVALRSALVHGDEATLFAGCGIMADSDPLREYEESRLKFRAMLSALGA